MSNLFETLNPNIDSPPLRTPQLEGFLRVREHYADPASPNEAAVVMPVGCGKSGLIAVLPFALNASRVLVVAPYVKLADQLYETFDPTQEKCFYTSCAILPAPPYPEPVPIRGTTTNRADLDAADVVITNIDQLQGADNRWLRGLPDDYFDLIVFDEGHHAVAESWETLKAAFPTAKVVNLSATPRRADGQLMPGEVVYSYPVREAIAQGYVKHLKALVLNPSTLRYVRRQDGEEIEVPLDEVRRLGETDAGFRRSIVSSEETLTTILDAAIRELRRIREETGDDRHKIITSALNYEHCHQIVGALRTRGLDADFVHSREAATANDRVLQRLENHDLDAIVQVRKLGEGFDHPYLTVAAVCSVFRELSPFVQFVGRIMRVIDKENTDSPKNRGTVVFHAGANIAQRWEDFRDFSAADQEYFDQLLPMEGLDFGAAEEIAVEPIRREPDEVEVREQGAVTVREIPLVENPAALAALDVLKAEGYTLDDIRDAYEHQPVPITRVRQRQASRRALDSNVQLLAGRILAEQEVNPEGHELDRARLGRTNFVTIKARIDRLLRERIADKSRDEYSQDELDAAEAESPRLRSAVEEEFFDGTA